MFYQTYHFPDIFDGNGKNLFDVQISYKQPPFRTMSTVSTAELRMGTYITRDFAQFVINWSSSLHVIQ